MPDFLEIEYMPNPQSRSADPAAREMLVRAEELGAARWVRTKSRSASHTILLAMA